MCHLHSWTTVSQRLLEEQICLFSVPHSLRGIKQLIQSWKREKKQLLSFENLWFSELAVVTEARRGFSPSRLDFCRSQIINASVSWLCFILMGLLFSFGVSRKERSGFDMSVFLATFSLYSNSFPGTLITASKLSDLADTHGTLQEGNRISSHPEVLHVGCEHPLPQTLNNRCKRLLVLFIWEH